MFISIVGQLDWIAAEQLSRLTKSRRKSLVLCVSLSLASEQATFISRQAGGGDVKANGNSGEMAFDGRQQATDEDVC